MAAMVRIDEDVHKIAEQLISTIPPMSRPSKQQLINSTLRAVLTREASKLGRNVPRKRKAG